MFTFRSLLFECSLSIISGTVRGSSMVDSKNNRCACPKYASATTKFMPGLMCVFCLKHSKLIGFHIMHHHESPKTAFQLFYTRWPAGPRVICYDNACNLSKYCLAREYAFFRDIFIIIDKFHAPLHKSCSPVYHPKFFPEMKHTNTEVCYCYYDRQNCISIVDFIIFAFCSWDDVVYGLCAW